MQLSRVLSISTCAAMAALLAGCDGAAKVEHPTTVPAAGTVTYNGSPVDAATVTLISADSKKSGWSCAGKTDAAGKFTIATVFAPGTEGKGVPAGDYTAVVTKFEVSVPGPMTGDAYTAAAKKKSDEDKARGKPADPSGPKDQVPGKYSVEATSDLKVKIEAAGNSNIELKLAD
jgi:hypothetical protein